ncbi:MAG: glycosyltransferase family 2 protein [Solirubrobacterales bacterium]
MRLSCVIPATDGPPTLARCIDAIRHAEGPPDELIVVTEPATAGPAAARNLGSLRATGEVLVFVDADVLVHADAFVRIRAAFEREPAMTALFGSYDDTPEAAGAVSGFRNLLHHHIHQEAGGAAGTFWAGLGAVRRDAFAATGGFDSERHPYYVEDIELGMRLTAEGARARLDPMLQGTHLKGWTLTQMVRSDYLGRGLPWARLLLRSRRLPATLNLGWRHRLSALASVAGAVALALRRPRAAGIALLSLLALNARFYRLLWRRRGPSQAVASVGLHTLHHLTGVASAATVAIESLMARIAGSRSADKSGAGTPRSREAAPPATSAGQDRLMNEFGTPSTGSSPTTAKPKRS